MASKQSSENESISDLTQDAEGNVDKIRQILFGGQMRDYEQRFDAMEKRITQNIERVSNKLEGQLEQLAAHTQSEVDKLTEQVKAERKDRISEGKEAGSALLDLKGQMEGGFAEIDEQLVSEAKELRLALVDQSDELSTLIRATHDQVSTDLQKEADGLADAKLGREDMAALLTELALRLSNDSQLPNE